MPNFSDTRDVMADEKESNIMKTRIVKCMFVALAVLVVLMTIALNMRLGSSGRMLLNDLFEDDSQTDHLKNLGFRDPPAEMKGNAHVHGHNHDQEVRFVLRESNLGAPEFIGKKGATVDEHSHGSQDHLKAYNDIGLHPSRIRSGNDFGLKNVDEVQLWKTKAKYVDNSIAIGLALTTKNQDHLDAQSLRKELPFFKSLMSSFCLTASGGFNYHFYVGHDHNDPFFHQREAHHIFEDIFYTFAKENCPRSFNISLHLVECDHAGQPAWAQNDAMMAAYMDHNAYYYRVNDDTIMETTGWAEKFIEELLRYDPPNVGVVGPWFKEGNIAILTHDFVHRTHIDVFGFYYPRVFTDWFADDWITGVYWPERCRKVPGTRVKHTMERGSRYVVHFDKANKVRIEVEIGKLILKRYLERKETGGKYTWNANSKYVISMSLTGSDIDKLYGALRYSQLIPIITPQWRMRLYVRDPASDPDASKVLKIIIKKLDNSGVEVIKLDNRTASIIPASMWRMLVADDEAVDRFIIRDANTRPSEREASSLADWLKTDKPFHCIRDHPLHSGKALVPSLIGGIPVKLKELLGQTWKSMMMEGYKSDIEFLSEVIWPKVKGICYCHDSVSCKKWPGAQAFPILRQENEFIGQRYDANDVVIDNDETLLWNKTFILPECVFVKNTGFSEQAVKAVIRHRPVLWSQDYHVTPVMDMKSLLSPIGVKIKDKSLSYYCGQVGTCANDLKIINKENGMRLSQELIEQFYNAYKNSDEMKQVTSFVCSLPVAMCEAFTRFNKSIIIWATIRYEQARPEPDKWYALNRLLLDVDKDPRSLVAANNLYDAKYIEYFTGIKPLVVPNYCGYLKDSYKPTRKHFLMTPLHSTELYDRFFQLFDEEVMKRQEELTLFPLREMYPQYLFSDLAAHPAIVYVPYQVSMVSLTEQYRMNIPLFFPTLELLAKWHVQYQVTRQRTWMGYMMKKKGASAIKGKKTSWPDPNNDLDEDAVKYWFQFADFYQWPHLIYYDSIPDLVDKMLNIDLLEISRRMKEHNEKVRLEIKEKWSQILLQITEGIPIKIV